MRPQYSKFLVGNLFLRTFALALFTFLAFTDGLVAQDGTIAKKQPASGLIQQIAPWMELLKGDVESFRLEGELQLKIDGRLQSVQLSLARWGSEDFDLVLSHPDYEVEIFRRNDTTAMALPKHQVVFVGTGDIDSEDHLGTTGIVQRLVGSGCELQPHLVMLQNANADQLINFARQSGIFEQSDSDGSLSVAGNTSLRFLTLEGAYQLDIDGADWKLDLTYAKLDGKKSEHFNSEIDDLFKAGADLRIEQIQRDEIERHLARGVSRALEVLLPSNQLKNPPQIPKVVPGGELRYEAGQRLVLLQGTPEQIGTAHGKLLKSQTQRCIDSVLYGFGTAQTIATGRWFRRDLEEAYEKLRPFIPDQHVAETRALALAIGEDPRVLEVLNVFPELFHCSGFAVFGSATADGKLYHGRVLDYMTTIGLQDCATTFIVKVDGKIPFANVGYAGFTGSVSGMNVRGISLGEMGGRGEGQWDGVPMATLMRRALEECDSLDQVMKLWSTSPRTCEYYYVFSDGKSNEAVGVAATPQSIQFVKPGEGHELLGDGIPDTIALSAGSRLETLRARIHENHGRIDVESAIWLMSRPVAMQSNLHNVLFIPEDGVFYVANADHSRPAAECDYVRYDLKMLTQQLTAKP